jgi:hypothetical protein
MILQGGKVYEIAADPEFEVMHDNAGVLAPVEKPVPASGKLTLPAASVSAVVYPLIKGNSRI